MNLLTIVGHNLFLGPINEMQYYAQHPHLKAYVCRVKSFMETCYIVLKNVCY